MPISNVIQNKNTAQTPMTATGLTGVQLFKYIPADRVYLKPAIPIASLSFAGFAKSNGQTPTGWTDAGTVDGNCKVTYKQDIKQVTTGPDEYLRGAYLKSRGGMIDFSLNQFDDVALQLVSGLTPSVIVPGSTVSFNIGSTDMAQLAVLIVSQDKLSGKEFQFFNPNVYLSYQPDMSSDAMVLKCSCIVPFFLPPGAATETIFTAFEFA